MSLGGVFCPCSIRRREENLITTNITASLFGATPIFDVIENGQRDTVGRGGGGGGGGGVRTMSCDTSCHFEVKVKGLPGKDLQVKAT